MSEFSESPLWEAAKSAHEDFSQLYRFLEPTVQVTTKGGESVAIRSGHLKRYNLYLTQDAVSFGQLQASGSSSIVTLDFHDGSSSNPATISLVDTAAEDVPFERVPHDVQEQTVGSVATATTAATVVARQVKPSKLPVNLSADEYAARADLYAISRGELNRRDIRKAKRRLADNPAMRIARAVHERWNEDNPGRRISFRKLTPRQQLEDLPYVRAGIRLSQR